MKSSFKKIAVSLLVFLFLIFFFSISLALTSEECEQKIGKNTLTLDEAKKCEEILDKLYQETGAKRRSLQSEVAKFNAAVAATTVRIYTTGKQIEALEKEIETLSSKIGRLDLSLDKLSQVLIKKIAATYKQGRIEPLMLFFSSTDFSGFVSRLKYFQVIQIHDRKLIVQVEGVRASFENQKKLKEERQTELETARKKLESQKSLLAQQKADKENLLKITQNNEAKYQQLLAATRAEIEAIQEIIAGRGQETEVGKVKKGETIASIISGASACSTGTHLHFQIAEGSDIKNPFDYLKGGINYENCSGSRCGSGDGDLFNPTGSWDWPLNEPIKFNQGFGSNTSAIRSRIVWYNFHTGIDISSADRVVKAIKDGTLYRGAIVCGGGTLRYVRLKHDEGNIDTYYLHVNY